MKTTSARVLLALVVAALVLAGCGGGSSDSSSSSSPTADTSGSPSSGSDGSSAAAQGGASAEAGAGTGAAAAKGTTGGGSSPGGGQQASPSGAHGKSVPQPKGEPEHGLTPQQRSEVTEASMSLQSPSSQASAGGPQMLPAEYTCDGRGTSPALSWRGVPQGTAELVLFAMSVQPVNGELFFDWAVAGLSPDLEEIEAGKLPSGAIVGRNSFGKAGYEICPEGGAETYVFTVFAIPQKLSPVSGFDPSVLRKEVLAASGNVGLLALSYARG